MKIKDIEQRITESFDSQPAVWKLRDVDRRNQGNFNHNELVNAEATFSVGSERYIIRARKYGGELRVAFAKYDEDSENTKDDLTGTGNQYKVLATVIDFLQWAIENHTNERILFSAKNERTQKDRDDYKVSKSRTKVYERLIQRYLQTLPGDWTYRKQLGEEGQDRYLLIKKDPLDDLEDMRINQTG